MKRVMMVSMVLAMLECVTAQAGNVTWVGTGGNAAWGNTANWDTRAVPAGGVGGDSVNINGVTSPAVSPVVSTVGAQASSIKLDNGGRLDVTAGTNGNWGLALSAVSSCSYLFDGTMNISGSYNSNGSVYVGGGTRAGSYVTVNVLAGGTMRYGVMLTMGSNSGNGEVNIWGTLLGGPGSTIPRWNFNRTSGVADASVIRLHEGGLWALRGDHVSTGEVADLIGSGRLVSGDSGFAVTASYDPSALYTNITLTAVPEPMTLALLAAGGLVIRRVRR